jgi:hypothetical protein
MTYQIQNDLKGNPCAVCKTNADGSGMSIPFDSNNVDFQEYQKWLSEGNTPLPAENT